MKKLFITSFILCAIFLQGFQSSYAQAYKNFDLSSYYTPDIVRSQLDLSGSSSCVNNNSVDIYKSQDISSHIYGNMSANFFNYKNTRKLIRTINVGLLLNASTSSDNNQGTNSTQRNRTFRNNPTISVDYQLFNTSKKFISFGGNFNYNYNYNSTSSKTDSSISIDDMEYSSDITANLYIGAGIGRIEDVTDAQQAVYLVKALTKNNVLSRDLSNNEIFNLAQEISRIKNKRFLDARLHLIDEVSHVDSFLIANQLIKKSDARYFTTLYDIWMYGDKFTRKSGQSLELRFTPNLVTDYSYSKGNNPITVENTDYSLSLIYNYEKPFLQKWQHSINATLIGIIYNSKHSYESDSFTHMKYTQVNASYKLGFYPNTRTNLYAQISQEAYYIFDQSYSPYIQSFVLNGKNLYLSTNLNMGTYYYISPQLRFTAKITISNIHHLYKMETTPSYDNTFNSNFSIGLNYSIF